MKLYAEERRLSARSVMINARQMEKRAEAKLLKCEAAVEEYLATNTEQVQAKELEPVHGDTDQIILDAVNRAPDDLFATEEEAAAIRVKEAAIRAKNLYDRFQHEISERQQAEWKAELEAYETEKQAKETLQKLQTREATAANYEAAIQFLIFFAILFFIVIITGIQFAPAGYY